MFKYFVQHRVEILKTSAWIIFLRALYVSFEYGVSKESLDLVLIFLYGGALLLHAYEKINAKLPLLISTLALFVMAVAQVFDLSNQSSISLNSFFIPLIGLWLLGTVCAALYTDEES